MERILQSAAKMNELTSTIGTTAACIGMTRTNTKKKIAHIENTAPSRVDLSQ
jgi:hypothetical protein